MSETTKNDKKFHLLIIDPQVDFHEGNNKEEGDIKTDPPFKKGSLSVKGSNDDAVRIAKFIGDYQDRISDITVTLDTHMVNDIGHQHFWVVLGGKEKENKPAPYTIVAMEQDTIVGKSKIKINEIEQEQKQKLRPADNSNLEYVKKYLKELQAKGRLDHCVWPDHCLDGSEGHTVVPTINDALQAWAKKERKNVYYVHKGQNCLSEMYSAIRAEVPVETDPDTQTNRKLINRLQRSHTEENSIGVSAAFPILPTLFNKFLSRFTFYQYQYEKLVICGQARSHCVNYTTRDICEEWTLTDEGTEHKTIKSHHKIFVLEDGEYCSLLFLFDSLTRFLPGCSNVEGFEKEGEEFFEDLRNGLWEASFQKERREVQKERRERRGQGEESEKKFRAKYQGEKDKVEAQEKKYLREKNIEPPEDEGDHNKYQEWKGKEAKKEGTKPARWFRKVNVLTIEKFEKRYLKMKSPGEGTN